MFPQSNHQQVAVKMVMLRLQELVSRHQLLACLGGANAYSHVDVVSRSLIVGLEARLLGDCEIKKVERREYVPEDWWQAVRERWAPRWWLRRWPVRKREITVKEHHEHWRVCPHVAPAKDSLHTVFLLNRDPYCCEFCKRQRPHVSPFDLEHADKCATCGKKMIPEAR